jgi:hypothetical protein
MAKPLADEAIDQERLIIPRGFCLLFYRAALPLSSKTLSCAAGVIRRHRVAIGSRRRKPNPGQEALLVLAYLRKDIPGA